MLIGQSVLAPGEEGGTVYYSPWMPRQGDAFTAVIEAIAAAGGTWSLEVQVQTKNNEDRDADASLLTGSTTLTSVTTKTFATSGAKELIRFKFTAMGDVGVADKWIHFRANPPIWQPN